MAVSYKGLVIKFGGDTTELQGALKQYAKRKDKNLHQLMEYAQLFRVERLLRQYMEVLL